MNYRPLGNSGISASVVGFGAWVLGGGQLWGQDPDDAESVHAIQKAIDLGINLIDTAPAYGFGRSEQIIGRAIKGRRDKVVIATKCGLWWDDTRGSYFADFEGKKVYRSLRPDTLRIEIENSLKRLGVDCIDLYQTHWPSAPPDFTPIADTMAVLLAFKDEGKIRALGVSNVSVAELEENIRCGGVVSDQLRYSMLNRDAEKDILPFCAKNKLATLTYMSLEQGLLTGKIGMDRVFKPGEFRANEFWNAWMIPDNRRRVIDLLGRWNELTDKYQCTLAQLVIAWTAAQPCVTHVLAGGRTVLQVTENVRAGELKLAPADIKRIREDVVALGELAPAGKAAGA
jgi:methylglyoxal reductase